MQKGEGVLQYEGRIKALWMQAKIVWSDEGDAIALHTIESVLYMIAYSGMHTWIKKAVAPLVSQEKQQFATIKELFFRAASIDVAPHNIRTGESTTSTTTNTTAAATASSSHGGDKRGDKRRLRDDRKEHTGSTTSVPYNKRQKTRASSDNTRPRAPFVSTEVYKARIERGECRMHARAASQQDNSMLGGY